MLLRSCVLLGVCRHLLLKVLIHVLLLLHIQTIRQLRRMLLALLLWLCSTLLTPVLLFKWLLWCFHWSCS